MSGLLRKVMSLLDFDIVYVHEWGEWSHRYNSVDYATARPIHRDMSVAPPSAVMHIRRLPA